MVNGASGRRRGGCLRAFLIVVVVVIVILIALDFVAKAFAQDKLASEIKSHGFPKKPSVSIAGFPFLTQVAARNIHKVTIRSTNVQEGTADISKVSAVMSGIHLNSNYTSGHIDTVSGKVLITFASLDKTLDKKAGPLGSLVGSSGLKLSAAGSNEVKASLNLLVTTASATWRVSRPSGDELRATLVRTGGLPASFLSSLGTFDIKIPKLPFGVKISGIRITPAGLVGTISGADVPFSSNG